MGNPSREQHSGHDSWDIGHLEELASNGSLAAARELMNRLVHQCERTSSLRPDLIEPTLSKWLKRFIDKVVDDPRQPVGDLMAGARPTHGSGKRLTPYSHAELVQAMSLAEEAYVRVQQGLDNGLPLKSVLTGVTDDLNALGYRNRRNEPLTCHLVRDRYYRVRQLRGRAVWRRRT